MFVIASEIENELASIRVVAVFVGDGPRWVVGAQRMAFMTLPSSAAA